MSGLEDLYREIILDHYRNPRNRGELPIPPAHRVEGFNPLCGDEIVVYLVVEDGRVSDLRIGGQGCSISQASTSMMSSAVKGRTVGEARAFIRAFKAMMSIHESRLDGDGETGADAETGVDAGAAVAGEPLTGAALTGPGGAEVDLGDLEALRGVVRFPVRIKCATLSWNTLEQGLAEADSQAS